MSQVSRLVAPPLRALVAATLFGAALTPRTIEAAATQVTRTYRSPVDGKSRTYDLRLPDGASGTTKLPVVLFLHGRGGSRHDFQRESYRAAADAGGYALLFWEGRLLADDSFSTYYVDGANGIADESDVLAALDDAIANLPIDPARVHLVGFSQGGKGALLVGLKSPHRFASVSDGAGPTDAFQGQLWAPAFPDFRDAAGGAAEGATGLVLARWFGQSPRFLLANARNLPLALFHGGKDDVVPDSGSLFPYRNTHHVADLPGFSDAHGIQSTLSQLHASDAAGWIFETHYPAAVAHEEEKLLDAAQLFAFIGPKVAAARPPAVSYVSYDAGERRAYWTRLGRMSPPDGAAVGIEAVADLGTNTVRVTLSGPVDAAIDLVASGLDPGRVLAIDLTAPVSARLRLLGGIGDGARLLRGTSVLVPGSDYGRDANGLSIPGSLAGSLTFDPSDAPVVSSDLLVPALVEAGGLNGARFVTELTAANVSASPLRVEALLLDGSGSRTTFDLAPSSVAAFTSSALFALFGRASGAFPLRLRVVGGRLDALVASARVSNVLPAGGSYGLSFPVATAGSSVLVEGAAALLLGGAATDPSRTNLSIFAPFEAATVSLTRQDETGRDVSTEEIALAPLQRVQKNDLFAGIASPARVAVLVRSGRVQAYGTVVSNASTNDPYRSPALPGGTLSRHFVVPAVASAPGRNGATFTSDVFLSALPATLDFTIPVTVTFRPRTGPAVSVETPLFPGSTRVLVDVVDLLFHDLVPSAGALEIDSIYAIQALAVTRSLAAAGPSSQDLPCVRDGDEVTDERPAAFVGLGESAAARSNVVLANVGPATEVRLSLLAQDGFRGDLVVALAAGEVKQVDSIARAISGPDVFAGALLVRPAAGGRIVASVARIDNVTNDPAGLAPVPFAP